MFHSIFFLNPRNGNSWINEKVSFVSINSFNVFQLWFFIFISFSVIINGIFFYFVHFMSDDVKQPLKIINYQQWISEIHPERDSVVSEQAQGHKLYLKSHKQNAFICCFTHKSTNNLVKFLIKVNDNYNHFCDHAISKEFCSCGIH